MLRIDFANLAAERPELTLAWVELSNWIDSHPQMQLFDPRQIAHSIRDVKPGIIAEALVELAERGYINRAWKVESPDGVLVGPSYGNPSDVPNTARDSLDRPFDVVKSGDIVLVYQKADANAAKS